MKKSIRILTTLFTMVILLSACGKEMPFAKQENTEHSYTNSVTTLDVGQANCTLIESDGKFRLIDRGRAGGTTNVAAYLNRRGVKKIDLFVISHFHYDHTSEALDIIRNFETETVLIPQLSQENIPDTYFYKSLVEDSKNGYFKLEYRSKDLSFAIGSGEIKVLSDTINTENINNTSIVMSYTNGDFVYVNTADMENDGDEAIVEYLPGNTDLFLASHHGSKDANSMETLEKLSPTLVVISRGKDNDYGHPHKEFLNRLNELNIPCLITYENGNIVYDCDSGKYFRD